MRTIKIPAWLKNIWRSIQTLFNRIPTDLQTAIHIGAEVTENLKNFVESPMADVITDLIPGETDNRIKIALRAALPSLLIQLKLADSCSTINSPEELTACAIKTLQSLSGNLKSAFLHNLAVLIAQVAADGKLTWQDGASIMEWYYQNQFKAKA
jgi:hypothetical protein